MKNHTHSTLTDKKVSLGGKIKRRALPLRICTSKEMRELDLLAENEYQIDAQLLMENAGRAAVQILFDQYPLAGKETEILVFAGKGNNAGDAFVVARRLLCLDRRVRVFTLVDQATFKGSTLKNFQILQKMKAKIVPLESGSDLLAFFQGSNQRFTVVDGILGTGLHGPIGGIFSDVVEILNKEDSISQMVALDVPTGVNGDTGVVESSAIRADLTISFGFPKLGHFLAPGAALRGTLVNVDISLPPRFRREGDKFLLRKVQMAEMLGKRDHYGHKNSFGHALVVGGSPGKLGAACLAARACHRMGTGLVTVATWEDSFAAILQRISDETMAVPIRLTGSDFENYRKNLKQASSLIVGPGMGNRPDGHKVLDVLLSEYTGPMVLDADALNIIADRNLYEFILKRSKPTVLTPHPGEMARLLHMEKSQVLADPIAAVKKLVEMTQAVVILKGPATIMGSSEDTIFLNHYPNDGMATAGSGDVLAGMVGGLLGQKFKVFDAALLGVYLHSLAGEAAAQKQGTRAMTATDLIDGIADAFRSLHSADEPAFPYAGTAKLH